MIEKATIVSAQGGLYLVALGGIPTIPMAALAGAARVKVDFEAKAIRREPLRPGDAVAVYLADQSGSTGLVLGRWGEGEPWIS